MRIAPLSDKSPSHGAARINILATADNHGNVLKMPIWLKTVENNAKDIFAKSEEKSTRNFFTIVGDWFINPSKKGYLTRSKLTNGELQNRSLVQTIDILKSIVKSTANKSTPLYTLFTPGNHCLDAGDDFLLEVMEKNPMKSIMTNVDLEKSPAVRESMDRSDKIVKSIVYSIQDDKNKNFFHKVLFLGVTIPSMDFYNPGLLEGMTFFDNCNKKDADLKEEDLQGTIESVRKEVENFKNDNPKGAVILLSHTGGRISELICKHVPQINLILNGHDHKNIQTNVGKTSINSLGKDNEMIKAINLEFDDNGDLVKSTMTPYFTAVTVADGLENHLFQRFLGKLLSKDLLPILTVKEDHPITYYDPDDPACFYEPDIPIEDDDMSIENNASELTYGNELRYSNSYLMNYLTSAINEYLQETVDKNLFTTAIQSSIVRGSLKDKANNLDIMKVFDGVSEDLSNLKIGTLKGHELVGLIVENIHSNLKAPTRNTIIHWSDVQIDRKMIADIKAGKLDNNYSDAIKVRDKESNDFIPIDLNKDYKMVINDKFLIKDDIEWPGKIRSRFKPINKTYDQLLKEYLKKNNFEINITSKTKEQRIL